MTPDPERVSDDKLEHYADVNAYGGDTPRMARELLARRGEDERNAAARELADDVNGHAPEEWGRDCVIAVSVCTRVLAAYRALSARPEETRCEEAAWLRRFLDGGATT